MNPSDQITTFRANQRHDIPFFHCWVVMFRNVWDARGLIWQLFKRDFFAQYKKSFVGVSWMFVAPIMGIIPWLFAWKAGLYNPGETSVVFPVYVLIGRSMWSLFNGFYEAGASTLGAGGGLMMQVNYPHESLLFKQTATGLANYLLSFVTNVVVMLLFGLVPSPWILALPLATLPLFFLGAAMGLIVSMIRVVAYDLNRIITILMGFLMWTTPLLYSDSIPSPMVQAIIKWNPLTYLVCSCRDIMLHGHFYQHNALAYYVCAAATFVFFMLSWRLFYVSETKLVERMV